MTTYVFETITATQAASFGANDYLVFIDGNASASKVSVAPYSAGGFSTSAISLTYNGRTVNFGSGLADASQNTDSNHLVFNDQSTLLVGSNTDGDRLASQSVASTTSNNVVGTVVYGLGGDDIITLGAGNDYAYGGTGADSITGMNGNYHVYGNATGASGTTDGADTITLGNGTNYVQGNAGNDMITVGTDGTAASGSTAASGGSTGYNRIFGGNDMDTITVHGGVGSIAMVNGNMGNDRIVDTSAGNNTLRGGQGDDMIIQRGASHDVIMGDAGADTIQVSGATGHVAVLTGGAGADYFDFSTAGAGAKATVSGMTYYQEVTDFTHGEDHMHLANAVTAVGHSSTIFASVSDAQVFAASQLSATGTSAVQVSALSVGTASSNSTYLFYNDGTTTTGTTTTANYGIIHLDTGASANVVASDFI